MLASLALLTLAPTAATPAAPEQAAIFKAAGFVRQGGRWGTRDCLGMESASYEPGKIDTYRDLNRDGRPEAVVTEGSAICYGNTGMHFWLLSRQVNGSWKPILDETATPDFLPARGVGGWPDISLGGPGFCFPVLRWNGKEYARRGFAYEGKPCRP
jgi:hypothetical protein